MKNIFINVKNLFPYLLLISIYFFFVNIEASKDNSKVKDINNIIENERKNKNIKVDLKKTTGRVAIPVIPYKK